MTAQNLEPNEGTYRPDDECIPPWCFQDVRDMFDTWEHVKPRNAELRRYYTGKVGVKNLGIAIPSSFEKLNVTSGWPAKAIQAHAMRSVFDGFVFAGREDARLKKLVRENHMRSLYQQAVTSALTYGVAFVTVMAGNQGQPDAKVRVFSANQACALWDKDEDRIRCGIALVGADNNGNPTRYVAHFPQAVVEFWKIGETWQSREYENPYGEPLMACIVNDPDPERPFGHSVLTPELLGIVDKAMRDILRMEIGAEFFTAPQRYVLGASEDLFTTYDGDTDEVTYVDADGNEIENPPVASDDAAKLKAYYGALWAITRDENGEIPTVGEFSAPGSSNLIEVFENDAQRFSGATNVPLAQLGVLSNNYTSSDALGAANDPLILEVETMNRRNAETMEDIARMMMCVADGIEPGKLGERGENVQCYLKDPSKTTFSAMADGWTKVAAQDSGIVGTDVWYEGMGLTRAAIDRLKSEKRAMETTQTLNAIADAIISKADVQPLDEHGEPVG